MQKLCVKNKTFFKICFKDNSTVCNNTKKCALKSVNPNKAGLFEGSSYLEKS